MFKSSKKSVNLTLIISIAVLSILILITFALFSLNPRYDIPELTAENWSTQSRLMLNILPKIYNAKPDDIATITLNENEVDTLLKLAANGKNLYSMFSLQQNVTPQEHSDYIASYKNGLFNISYAYPVSDNMVINLQVVGSLTYNNRVLDLKLTKAYAGYYPLNCNMLENFLLELFDNNRTNPKIAPYIDSIKEIKSLPKNAMEITYYPNILRLQLQKQLKF